MKGSSPFSIVNLKRLEESELARAAGIEARFAREQLDSEHLGVTYMRYDPHVWLQTAHSHREQEEVYVVVGGSGRVRIDAQEHELELWDVVRCSPRAVRAFAAGPDGLELIAVGSDRPEGGDSIRSPATWRD
jgi:mannose-6-phosphate isomerase-like protein (cupin superfamily)